MAQHRMRPSAVIFDFDGTLADSMWVWDEVDAEFARRRGLPFEKEDAEKIAALGFEGTAEWMVERYGLADTVEDLIGEWYELAAESYANDVRLKPGAEAFVRQLKAHGIPVAIATSLSRDMLEPALENNGVKELFDELVVCEEVCEGGKSTPAVYLETVRRLGVALGDSVVFEDVALAARSAKAGGAYVVGVRDDHAQQVRSELIEAADLFIQGFGELLR
ncbi:MAG: HAD family hydrolase [Coriobacteriales bacterium]